MQTAVFSAQRYDREFLSEANKAFNFELAFFDTHLNAVTAKLAFNFEAVCVFVNDDLGRETLKQLSEHGTKLIVLRCAGFNNVDLAAAKEFGMTTARVPAYSPHGVAEHAVALMLALNRKLTTAHNRIREGNFSLEGLLGFEIYGKTAGVAGTGKIGKNVARILQGFGCRVLAFDPYPDEECRSRGIAYVSFDELVSQSDIITLHLPLMKATHHLVNAAAISRMKRGAMLINTSRGGLIDTKAVIAGLKSGRIGYLGLDVYEEEGDVFFQDLSGEMIQDDVLARLLTFPNVLMTGHQAFFTRNALHNIALTTLQNIQSFMEQKIDPRNLVTSDLIS